MTIALRHAIGVCAITLMAPLAASAQESTNVVSSNTDWNVFVDENPKECWGVSKPKESVNTKDGQPVSVRRGDILLFVTYTPGKQPELSFTGGYPFAPGSTVTVAVGSATFDLFSDGEWAWSGSAEADATILRALRGGADAIVSARSGRGTQTRDQFSLRGFSAAMDDAAARCK